MASSLFFLINKYQSLVYVYRQLLFSLPPLFHKERNWKLLNPKEKSWGRIITREPKQPRTQKFRPPCSFFFVLSFLESLHQKEDILYMKERDLHILFCYLVIFRLLFVCIFIQIKWGGRKKTGAKPAVIFGRFFFLSVSFIGYWVRPTLGL